MYRIKKYKKGLNFSEYITQGAHDRTGAFTTTDDPAVVKQKMELGWMCEQTKNGYWLRAPDISLVDITEPFRIYQFGDEIGNLACFRYLKNLENNNKLGLLIGKIIHQAEGKYSNFGFYISKGKVLEGEIRIGGSDFRIYDLKSDLLHHLIQMEGWRQNLAWAKNFLGKVRKINIVSKENEKFDQESRTFTKKMKS